MGWQDDLWRQVNRMQEQIDRILANFTFGRKEWTEFEGADKKYRRAFTNFEERDKEFVIQVELPGVEKEDINLSATENGIEIKAEKKRTKKSKFNEGYSYTKSYAGFYQSIAVPSEADLEKIEASYKNGVLTIRIPKKSEAKNKKTIRIK